jgi:hypothetical protein
MTHIQNTNNFIPTIIARSARRAAHFLAGDKISLTYYKSLMNRTYRHKMKLQMQAIVKGRIDADSDEYDDSAKRLTGWDVD